MFKVWSRPRIVVSRCLGFDACRWNGATIPDEFIDALKPFVDFETVCPEMQIGLGVPRKPIRIVSQTNGLRLVQSETNRDVTDEMTAFAEKLLTSIGPTDGFVLKSRSPSCGIKDSKIYPGMGQVAALRTSAGFFGQAVLAKHPLLAVEDEGRMNNERLWDHFLKRIFSFASFREMKGSASMADLVKFQAENKLLIMSYSQKELRILGRIVANKDRKPIETVKHEYEEHLRLAMSKIPRPTSNINVAMHMLGYFSDELGPSEKEYFLSVLDKYRSEHVPLSVPVSLLRAWAIRFDQKYLLSQTFLEPYPEELLGLKGKGEAREVKAPS